MLFCQPLNLSYHPLVVTVRLCCLSHTNSMWTVCWTSASNIDMLSPCSTYFIISLRKTPVTWVCPHFNFKKWGFEEWTIPSPLMTVHVTGLQIQGRECRAMASCYYNEPLKQWWLLRLFSSLHKNTHRATLKWGSNNNWPAFSTTGWPQSRGVKKYGSPGPMCCRGLIVTHCVVLHVCAGGKLTGSQSHSDIIYNALIFVSLGGTPNGFKCHGQE